MGARRSAIALGMLFALAGAVPAGQAAFLDSNLAVSPAAHANGGGCYPVSLNPGLLDMLTLVDPEWAAIDVGAQLPPLSDPVTIHGTVNFAKINESGDFPGDHESDDENTFITLDSSEMALVGTGNVGPHGVEQGQMEVEWEIGKYPLFAWPGSNDRMTGVGRWIWDCGHPDPDPPGTCSVTMLQQCAIDVDCAAPECPTCIAGETCVGPVFNYHSELHPPQAVAVSRIHGYKASVVPRGGKLATRTDVWISPDGGGAGDACLLGHIEPSTSLLNEECFPLSRPIANVNASDFAFDIPLPPRPAGVKRGPRVRVIDRTPSGLPRPAVTTTFVDGPTPVVHAVVAMTTPVDGVLPSGVGKTIVARWPRDHTRITRLRVLVTGIEIVNPLKPVTPAVALRQRCSVTTGQDCSTTPCPSGETCLTVGGPTPGWQIFLEANGDWHELPGLGAVAAPGTIALHERFLVGLPAGDMLHFHATGKSLGCLEAQLYGRSVKRDLALYGLTNGAACLVDMSKNIGAFDLTLPGPDFGSGGRSASYVTQSVGGDGGACSTTTTQLCLTDADCPSGETCVVTGGAFKLHYTITKLH